MIRSRCPVVAQLVTLKDAGTYIIKLPKAEQKVSRRLRLSNEHPASDQRQ
jgi:hypothetical protein